MPTLPPSKRAEARTQDLIRSLSRESNGPLRLRLRRSVFARYWIVGASAILSLSLFLLPVREDLAERFASMDYYVLFSLWFLAAMLSAINVYAMAFPDGRVSENARKWGRFAAAPLVALSAWGIASLSFADFSFQLYRESNYLNGGCGLVIFTAGLIHAGFLFSWLRQGAPTQPVRAGAWVAISTGAYASFIVQFACPNEHALHVVLWHFVPMALLTGAAALSARRILRW